jgi:hypothetical protein
VEKGIRSSNVIPHQMRDRIEILKDDSDLDLIENLIHQKNINFKIRSIFKKTGEIIREKE